MGCLRAVVHQCLPRKQCVVCQKGLCVFSTWCVYVYMHTYIIYCTFARHCASVSAAQQCVLERPFGMLHWVRIDATHVYMYDTPYMYSM